MASSSTVHEMMALADIARKLIREAKEALGAEEAPNTELSEQSAQYIKELAEQFEVW